MRTPTKPLTVATIALLVGGVVGAATSGAAPAAAWIGDTVQARAAAVANSDRVDGFHAVKASATPAQRKNKLVATNSAGRLPDDIIKKAPDADRLDGVDGAAYRFIPLDLGAGLPIGDTTSYYRTGAFGGGGINVPDTVGNRIGWGLVLPPSFQTGATLKIRMQWHIDQTGCTVSLLPNSATHERVGLVVDNGIAVAGLGGGGTVSVPAVAETTTESVFTAEPTRSGTKFQKRDNYSFSVYRATSDTCTGPVVITGVAVTY
ncbi:hypothetical protein [Nocardioides plantarum]|uniref:Uncharacterized protein n=1 Tax=Nocardioides plantarum TaxID=29299 RepID=A0ABV5KE18_9ACTN|nr:hypothetical protein [Nocardioides plantarum]